MSTSVSRVAAGGVLALLGLVVLKFIIGMFVAVTGIFMFFLVKVVPILLIGMIVMWLWKKFTRNNESPAS